MKVVIRKFIVKHKFYQPKTIRKLNGLGKCKFEPFMLHYCFFDILTYFVCKS